MSKSAWCASAIATFMRRGDQKSDQLTDPERMALQQRITTLEAEKRECEQARKVIQDERDRVIQEHQALMISTAKLEERVKSQDEMMEERVKSQGMIIEELRTRAVHAEGIVQTLMAERQALLPQKAGFWSRLFGKG